jgi:phosphohistidine phosphatase SixA
MKLIVMRHAKSSWKESLPDKERPLKGRGRKAATDVGARLGRKSLVPNLVLVSDAVRARQTWEHCWNGIKSFDTEKDMVKPRIIIAPSLYDPGDVDGYLKPLSDNVQSNDDIVQLIAHWPGVEEFIRFLLYPATDELKDVNNERGKTGDREYMEDEGGKVPEMKTSFACILSTKVKDWKSALLKPGYWTIDRVITPSQEFRGLGHVNQVELGLPSYYQGLESQDEHVSISDSWVDPDDE